MSVLGKGWSGALDVGYPPLPNRPQRYCDPASVVISPHFSSPWFLFTITIAIIPVNHTYGMNAFINYNPPTKCVLNKPENKASDGNEHSAAERRRANEWSGQTNRGNN